MTLHVNVEGGTGAGRKRKPVVDRYPWVCPAGHQNPAYASTCLGSRCNHKRP